MIIDPEVQKKLDRCVVIASKLDKDNMRRYHDDVYVVDEDKHEIDLIFEAASLRQELQPVILPLLRQLIVSNMISMRIDMSDIRTATEGLWPRYSDFSDAAFFGEISSVSPLDIDPNQGPDCFLLHVRDVYCDPIAD